MKKVFVLDTNILLNDPASIFKFDDNDVVIPISVIEEIDKFKSILSETGRNAREVSRILDRLRQRGALSAGVPVFEDRKESGQLFVYLGNNMDILPDILVDNTDNHILAIALTLQKQFVKERKVKIITRDTNLRLKADAFGIEAEDFEADKVDVSHLYTGHVTMQVEAKRIGELYEKGVMTVDEYELAPNQFVSISDKEDTNRCVYGIFDGGLNKLRMLEPRTEGVWGIFPRNVEQIFGLEALLNDSIKLVTLSGGAGTGKTLLVIACGLTKITDEDVYHKLLVSRPIFPLGKDIGYLPGDLEEKLNPWMQPIYDNLELLLGGQGGSRQKRFSKSYQELMVQGMLQIEPLTYIRGRSLPNQFFVVDEAQNLTPHEIKTILTRAGEGTKVVLTGDPYQIDNPYIDSENNGLTYVIDAFKNSHISAHVSLKRGERSELATLAANLL